MANIIVIIVYCNNCKFILKIITKKYCKFKLEYAIIRLGIIKEKRNVKMVKKFVVISIIFILMLALSIQNKVCAVSPTLGDIVEKFNNSKEVEKFKGYGFEMNAFYDADDANSLKIVLTKEGVSETITYELNGNVLSNTHLVESNLMTAYFLSDSIGQVNGYNDGKLLNNMNMFEDEFSKYTLEKEGLEIKEASNGYYSAKMDITKKVPLIDESKFYLKPSDFDHAKDLIKNKENGNAQGKKAKLVYEISVDEDENYICIGEENKITQSTYNSILSALEVMYNKDVVEFFKAKYPKLDEGIYQLDGFDVEYDMPVDFEESPIYTNTKVVKVTINNKFIKDAILRTEYIGEEINRGNKTITLDFITNKSYKLWMFDNANSNEIGFLYKNILEDVFIKGNGKLENDNTVFFNIENGKIVTGDKTNSLFKLVINEEDYSFEILPTKTDVEKTTAVATHKDVKAKEYQECDYGHGHFRYGVYNDVTVNVIYGNEAKKEEKNVEVDDKSSANDITEKENNAGSEKTETNKKAKTIKNPSTGDDIVYFVGLFVISITGGVIAIKKLKNNN